MLSPMTWTPRTAAAVTSDQGVSALGQHAPSAVVMVRPHHTRINQVECADNLFMSAPTGSVEEVARTAYLEVSRVAEQLREVGVEVHLFEDTGTDTPDSVFPNNWLTTHPDGTVAMHSMRAPSRRLEPRLDIVDTLRDRYAVRQVHDLRHHAEAGRHLEGTGVMVIDHLSAVAYVGRSARTDEGLLADFCAEVGLRPVVFDTADRHGLPVYHTNVLMALGTDYALICLDLLPDDEERSMVRAELEAGGREVIELSIEQIENFAGNALEVTGRDARHLVMSARGVATLTLPQRHAIEHSVSLLPVEIPTVEYAGGSARCMLAGVHLPTR